MLEQIHEENTVIAMAQCRHKESPGIPLYSYGLGCFLNNYRGKLLISHGAGVDGMVSQTGFLPEINLGLVILTNKDRSNFTTPLMYQIIDAYLSVSCKDWNKQFMRFWKKIKL